MKKIISIWLFILAFAGLNAQSTYIPPPSDPQAAYTIRDAKAPVRIGRYVGFFEDKSGKMSFEEIQKRTDFVVKDQDVPNFNITKDAVWGRIKLTCEKDADWYLQIDPASFNEVVLYQKTNGGSWSEEHIGNAYPKEQRPLPVNHYMFRLQVKPGDTTTVFFKMLDYYPMQLEVNVGSIESFIGPQHDADIYNGICYGIMIMMLIYNFYLYITQKSVVYIYYVLYVFCSMVFSAYLSGYALHFPPLLLKLIRFAPILPPAGFGAFGLLFTITLFKEDLTHRFKTIVYIFIVIAVSDCIISIFPSLVHLSENIIQPLGLVLGILCISAAIIARRHSSAHYYLVGFGAYMFSLFYLILSAQGIFKLNNFTWHALVTGSAIESIMLSFALGDKLKMSLREQQKAQEQALVQLTENERLVREQNMFLEKKVKERTLELEEKNKEVLDSIHYARRIQQTLLAHDEFLKANLPEHFVLFKPKDIVSGDFYWATVVSSEPGVESSENATINTERRTTNFYLAVCDSTGHGVPGAFMSLLNISFLNEAITEKNMLSPDKVFDHVRHRLISTISQDGGKDGMDGILCCFEMEWPDKSIRTLRYSASNNAPLLIRSGEIVPLEKDKMPVGKGELTEPFHLYTVDLKKGDHLYLFTDGFADQFGGPKGKKFKYRQLTETILGFHAGPMSAQKEILEKTFSDWKGLLEQVDDVLVIGIRI